jgi:hypothetical protein
MSKRGFYLTGLAMVALLPANASLTTFQTYVGNVSYSSDGFASVSQSGVISASVPAGSTVLAAYLYSATNFNPTGAGVGATLDGSAVTFSTFVLNTGVCCNLGMSRADVTSIVKPIIDAGPGGIYDFDITEASGSQDGEALVVVYSNASLPTSTVAILDGFSAAGGDAFTAFFGVPLDPTAPGFFAQMALGINFSCGDANCGSTQSSNVSVNGTLITQNAGNYDDSDAPPPGNASNGALFTMGGFDDPFSTLLPAYADDHELYDLVPYISLGDLSIFVQTNNPTNDDNIFLALFATAGEARVVTSVPEPSTALLLGAGVLALAIQRRRALSDLIRRRSDTA